MSKFYKVKPDFKMPEKLSDCIILALRDLESVEKSRDFKVDMNAWFESNDDDDGGKCCVCFAGAVMAQHGAREVGPRAGYTELTPRSFGFYNSRRFLALNHIRNGHVPSAFRILNLDLWAHYSIYDALEPLAENLESYEVDPKNWLECMQTIAGVLSAEGL